jgi:hypothetical protein
MRIGILGAGAEGSGLAALLAREPDVEAIRFGDVDVGRLHLATSRVEALGVNVDGVSVDGTDDHAVANWAEKVDIVFNATAPPCNLPTMRGCLKAGAHYLDMNSGPFEIPGVIPKEQTIDAQFELNDAFAAAGLTAISCCGVAPGWVDLIARYISDTLDTIDRVIVRWVEWSDGRELISTVGPFLIANFNMPRPICWDDGHVVGVDLRASEELYEWPEPIGPVPLFTGFLHPELRTIQNIGREIGHIEVKSGLSNGPWRSSPEIWIEALRRQLDEGAAVDVADLPQRLGASFIPPEEYDRAIEQGIVTQGVFAVSVQVVGTRADQRIDHTVLLTVDLATARQHIPWGTHMVYATIGTTPITLVTMLMRGELESRGVIGVGGLAVWRTVLERVAERGHEMTERVELTGPVDL